MYMLLRSSLFAAILSLGLSVNATQASASAIGSFAETWCRTWGEMRPNPNGGSFCTLQWACTDGSGGSYGGTDPSVCSVRA